MSIKAISFADGIREKDIQDNFDYLYQETIKNRLLSGGYGIISGLELSIDGFEATIEAGEFINKDGDLVTMPKSTKEIDLPFITQVNENVTVNAEGRLFLSRVPYSKKRNCTVQYEGDRAQWGITVASETNSQNILTISSVTGSIITVNATYSGMRTIVNYGYAMKRIDAVCVSNDNIAKEYRIVTYKGTPSASPSMPAIPIKDLLLGYIEIDPYHINALSTVSPNTTLIEINRELRKLFVDDGNNIYINGTDINNMRFIYANCPLVPKPGDMWFDWDNNKLKIWKLLNEDDVSSGYWDLVNDTSMSIVNETKIWTPDINPVDKQTFLFSSEDTNMRFAPGTNALTIIINNKVLMSDQFDEIIDAESSNSSSSGIGFRLSKALPRATYVEARASHKIFQHNNEKIYQRTTTIVHTDVIEVINALTKSYTTDIYYKLGENQLDVFLNGALLINGVDITEGTDLAVEDRIDGAFTKGFTINKDLTVGDKIIYKICTNIFSYSSFEKFIQEYQNSMQFDIDANTESIESIQTEIDTNILKKSSVLTVDNFPESILKELKTGIINHNFTKISSTYETFQATAESYMTLWNVSDREPLFKDIDYTIEKNEDTGALIITFVEGIADGKVINMSGIKFED